MQGGGGGRDNFSGLGDPFAGFGGFGRPPSLMSSIVGGRDPFEDPFFTQPFGMMGPSLFGPSMFGASNGFFPNPGNGFFLNPGNGLFPGSGLFPGNGMPSGFLEESPRPSQSRGPIIKELTSDDEEDGEGTKVDEKTKENPRKHSRPSKEPYVEQPDDEISEKRPKLLHHGRQYRTAGTSSQQPQMFTFQSSSRQQPQMFTFQSSTVQYGGPNGAYYTASTTQRSGSDGITFEEVKEADTTTGRATHMISKGMEDKGHSVTRKLNSDGRVDTSQILHNLNQDELSGFEETWEGKAKEHLPGWNPGSSIAHDGNLGANLLGQQGIRALPSTAHRSQNSSASRRKPHKSSSNRRAQ